MIFIQGNVPSSKNSKRWTGKMLINSKTVMKYIKETKSQYEENRINFQEMIAGLEFPVVVSFKFIRGSKHKFDYINPAQTVQDLMVKNGWIEDDNCDFMIPTFVEYEYNKENPGVEINVYGRQNNTIS
jgi:hypothetical protein